MKKTALFLAAFLCIAQSALADRYVNGYTRSDGTVVQGHWRSGPDSSYNNNYSTRGNTNPYTGQSGTQPPTWNDRTPQNNIRSYGDPGYRTNNGFNR